MNRFYAKIWESVNAKGGAKKWLFEKGVTAKSWYLENEGEFKHKFYDVVFKPVREMFGGNIKKMLVGSAPIAPEVLTFFKIIFGIHINEGYGFTEASAVVTLTHPKDPSAG